MDFTKETKAFLKRNFDVNQGLIAAFKWVKIATKLSEEDTIKINKELCFLEECSQEIIAELEKRSISPSWLLK